MVGLSAYFDESGHADDPKCRFVGLVGICASEAAWTLFDESWPAILDAQCGGEWFHVKENPEFAKFTVAIQVAKLS